MDDWEEEKTPWEMFEEERDLAKAKKQQFDSQKDKLYISIITILTISCLILFFVVQMNITDHPNKKISVSRSIEDRSINIQMGDKKKQMKISEAEFILRELEQNINSLKKELNNSW